MPTTAAGDVLAPTAERVWKPRPWRDESRRTDLRQVGRFAHERALRRREINLSAGAHHVASVLASYGDEDGRNIFPSQETLAEVCRRSVRYVRAKLRELTELGLVRRLSHGGGRPSYRNGRRRRVTPARYELTLPLGVSGDAKRPQGGGSRRQGPRRNRQSGDRRSPQKQPTEHDTQQPPRENGSGLSAQTVEQIRAALGVTTLSGQQAEAIVTAAVARAAGVVRDRIAYALAVIRSQPAAFLPAPDVTEPACPLHGQHPATRCPECADARSDPPPAWTQMRDALRRARAP